MPRAFSAFRIRAFASALVISALAAPCLPAHADEKAPAQTAAKPSSLTQQALLTYTDIAYAAYGNAYLSAKELLASAEKFATSPSESELQTLKETWLVLRKPYLITEAYRFYDGPIDVFPQNIEIEGPEGRINGWPIKPGYLDGGSTSLIGSKKVLNGDTIRELNRKNDEREIAAGFHAIELILWGEDGKRTIADFEGTGHEAQRRRDYLIEATQVLAHDILYLRAEWEPNNPKSYKHRFLKSNSEALSKILTGLATLTGYEIPGKHLGIAAMDGGSPALQSPYSLTSHEDLLQTMKGIQALLNGEYATVKGIGLLAVIEQKDKGLAKEIRAQVKAIIAAIDAIPTPMENSILRAKSPNNAQEKARAASIEFTKFAKLMVATAKTLNVPIEITGD